MLSNPFLLLHSSWQTAAPATRLLRESFHSLSGFPFELVARAMAAAASVEVEGSLLKRLLRDSGSLLPTGGVDWQLPTKTLFTWHLVQQAAPAHPNACKRSQPCLRSSQKGNVRARHQPHD